MELGFAKRASSSAAKPATTKVQPAVPESIKRGLASSDQAPATPIERVRNAAPQKEPDLSGDDDAWTAPAAVETTSAQSPATPRRGFSFSSRAEVGHDDGGRSYEHNEEAHTPDPRQQRRGRIVEPLGLGQNRVGVYCGLHSGAFEGFSPEVPPGSHYDEWVWNALDRDGHVTIELYVDAEQAIGSATETASMADRTYSPGRGPARKNPKFDPNLHCLISVPAPKDAPWGDAKRVLLTPKTLRRAPEYKKKEQRPSFVVARREESTQKPAIVSMLADPPGIVQWLAGNRDHGVIFGNCTLAAPGKQLGDEFWMVLSLNEVKRVHDQVTKFEDGREIFGREGVAQSETAWEERGDGGRQRATREVPLGNREPVPASHRVFGWWQDDVAAAVLQAARQGAGPVMPDSWPQEDVDYVASTHASRRAANEGAGQTHTIVEPMQPDAAMAGIQIAEAKTPRFASRIPAQRPRMS